MALFLCSFCEYLLSELPEECQSDIALALFTLKCSRNRVQEIIPFHSLQLCNLGIVSVLVYDICHAKKEFVMVF